MPFVLRPFHSLYCGLILLSACAAPRGGSVSTSYEAPPAVTFSLVRDSLERMGYAVTKEDTVSWEIQAASGPYGVAPRQCQGNELWVYLTAQGTRTHIIVQEWYRGGFRLLSKPKENCEPQAKALLSMLDSPSSQDHPTAAVVAASPAFSVPSTKTELLLDDGVRALIMKLIVGIKEHKVTRVAVFPITDGQRNVVSPLSTYLAEKITNALYDSRVATVVERTRLVRIMEELTLTASPRFDDRSVKSVGKLAGVDAIVLGVYTGVGSRIIEINARLVSVETAELLGVASVRIPETPVKDLLR